MTKYVRIPIGVKIIGIALSLLGLLLLVAYNSHQLLGDLGTLYGYSGYVTVNPAH